MNRRTQLKISYTRLSENIEQLFLICGKSKVIPMIKANAYGHGDVEIFNFIREKFSIKQFGLASLEEALRIRKLTNSFDEELIVFSDTLLYEPDVLAHYSNNNIVPVISGLDDLRYFLQDKNTKFLPIYLKLNTVMNRLGVNLEDIDSVIDLLKQYKRCEIQHLMTHFSSSSEKITKTSKTYSQYIRFKEIKKKLLNEGIEVVDTSVANSGAIEQSFGLDESHVRPGLMIYGPSSLESGIRSSSCWKGSCISQLQASVLQINSVKKGSEIGYGNTVCPRDGLLLIAGIGYGDGFSTGMSGLRIPIGKTIGEVIGKVNMDMIAILLDKCLTHPRGEHINLWKSDNKSILNISDQQGIIPYEIFCNLSQRVSRVYES